MEMREGFVEAMPQKPGIEAFENKHLKVFLFQRDDQLVERIRTSLSSIEEVFEFQISRASTLTEALQVLNSQTFDIGLLDLSEFAIQPWSLLSTVSKSQPGLPWIILGDNFSDSDLDHFFKAGAQDCLSNKEVNPSRLYRSLRSALVRQSTLNEIKRVTQIVEQDSLIDSLSGLLNRRGLLHRLEHSIARAERESKFVAVLYVDLDQFKPINDKFGHATGDEVIRCMGQRIRNVIRKSDSAGRLGGDEFVLILEEIKRPEELIGFAHRLMKNLSYPIDYKGNRHLVESSVGVAVYPLDGKTCEELLEAADIAMYEAKRNTETKFVLAAKAVQQKISVGIALETQVQKIIEARSLKVLLKPVFNLKNLELSSVDLQFHSGIKEIDDLSIEAFFSLAQRAQVYSQINLLLLNSIRELRRSFPQINISLSLSGSENISDFIDQLRASKIDSHRLSISLLESQFEGLLNQMPECLEEFRKLDIKLWLEDFGSETCSLKNFVHDQVHCFRLNSNLWKSQFKTHFVQALMAMALSQRLELVADSILNLEDLQLAQTLGFNLGCGPQLGTKLNLENLRDLLTSSTNSKL